MFHLSAAEAGISKKLFAAEARRHFKEQAQARSFFISENQRFQRPKKKILYGREMSIIIQ
jgi:hypothetical protein